MVVQTAREAVPPDPGGDVLNASRVDAPAEPVLAKLHGLLSLACAGALAAVLAVSVRSAPAEDAAILMRYVQHVAMGEGVVWNIGDRPVDGATDLLPLLAAAGLAALGASAEGAVKLVALAAHVATALVVFWVARSRSPGWLLAAIILFGPGWVYGNAGFVTPVFGLLAALLVIATARGVTGWSAVVAFLLVLTRPEGIALAGLVVGAVFVRERRLSGHAPIAWLLVCLAAYAIWRRWYFGDWVPSPYFIKGGFRLHMDGVIASANFAGRFLWFALVPAAIAWRRGGPARGALVAAAIPVGGFALLWTLLSGETNFGGRFQYAALPLAAASLALASQLWWPAASRARSACVAVLAVAAIANAAQYRPFAMQDGRLGVGQALARFTAAASPRQPMTRTMAVTEAGLVPFYSRWRAVDALGFNDADVARRRIDAARLDRERPDVLLVHRVLPLDARPDPGTLDDRTAHAGEVLFSYARARGYVLVRAWGAHADDTQAYLVRSGAPDAADIVRAIRLTPHPCRVVSRGEVGLYGSIRRLTNFVRGVGEPAPRCVDWSAPADR